MREKKWGSIGKKETQPLFSFEFEDYFSEAETLGLNKEVSLGENLKIGVYFLEAKLINRYSRKYFLSTNAPYRTTLNFNIQFDPVRPFSPVFLKNTTCETYSALELKHNHIYDNEAPKNFTPSPI